MDKSTWHLALLCRHGFFHFLIKHETDEKFRNDNPMQYKDDTDSN